VADAFMIVLMILVAAGIWLAPLILSIMAIIRTRRIQEMSGRLERLEELIRRREVIREAVREEPVVVIPEAKVESPRPVEPPPAPRPVLPPTPARYYPPRQLRPPIDWEWFIGRRALGWIAAVLVVFATAFFLRYAIENQWIGALGRVSLAALGGMGLVYGGWRYDRRGWRLFAAMLTSAGLVLFYLSTYTSFGFYNLVPRPAASAFLVVIVAESMVLALLYDSMPLGLVAILGGLLTPVLMTSEHDQYLALFTYLVILNVGVVLLALRRDWPAVATVALLGTHVLFWMWYQQYDHPEKRPAALAFHVVIYALFLGYALLVHLVRRRPAGWESLARWLANAFLAFSAFYVLLKPAHEHWMGTLALAMAAVYAGLARLILATRAEGDALFMATLAAAVGFIALAFPIQADASWIAVGWSAEAAALWWFGLRLQSPALRVLATALAVMAVGRVLFIDTPRELPGPFVPILNRYALPALGVSAFLLGALATTRRYFKDVSGVERSFIVAAGVCGVVLVGLILSVDVYRYCDLFVAQGGAEGEQWSRTGQVALSVLWAVYATVILAVGFRVERVWLRWTALAWYALTLAKVFIIDLSGLGELYRVLAFFVLAIALGIAARAYQSMRPARQAVGVAGGGSP
jgi:uncharacterized membrane protein